MQETADRLLPAACSLLQQPFCISSQSRQAALQGFDDAVYMQLFGLKRNSSLLL
jgi:hypothetical protein